MHQLTGSCEEYYHVGYLNGGLSANDLTNDNGNLLDVDNQAMPYWWHAWYHTYSQQLRSEIRFVYKPNNNLNLISGLEYRNSIIQGQYIYSMERHPEETAPSVEVPGGNHFASQDFGVFSQADYWLLNNLKIVLGGRLDYNKIRVNGGYGFQFNPKAAVVFSPSDFVFKAIYSEAYMDAGYWTKFGTTPARLLNNPTLQPEEVRNIDISAAWKINDFFFTDVSAYNSNYYGAVGTANVSFIDEAGDTIQTTQHQPIGNLQVQGAQARLNFKYNNYSAWANYTFTNPYQIEENNERVRIGDIANHQVNIGVNALFFRKLNINLRTNIVGEKPTGENTTVSANPLSKIAPYYTLNGAISYNIYKRITLQVTAFNILGLEYYHPGVRSAGGGYYAAQMPQNERSIFGKLLIQF